MSRNCKYLLWVCLLVINFLPVTGECSDAVVAGWSLDVASGGMSSWWFTSDDDDNEETVGHAIDYDAGETYTWIAEGILRRQGRELLGLRVASPFNQIHGDLTINQRTTDPSASKVDFYFLQSAGLINPKRGGILRLLAGIRLDYHRFFYFGKGVAVENATFSSRNTGEISLVVGDEFSYETNFEDWYLSLFSFGEEAFIRLGVYRSIASKPLELMVPNNYVVESHLEGTGAFVNGGSDFWNLLLRVGSTDFESRGTVNQPVFQGSGSLSFLLALRFKPSLTIIGSNSPSLGGLPRLALRPTVGALFRADYLNAINEPAYSAYGELSMDVLLDFGFQVVWRF